MDSTGPAHYIALVDYLEFPSRLLLGYISLDSSPDSQTKIDHTSVGCAMVQLQFSVAI